MIVSRQISHKLSGLTLIEVLVSIAIISILLSIVYVSFGEARDSSRNRAWQAELKEVELALELYKSQYGDYPPTQIDSFFNSRGCFSDNSSGVYIRAGSKDIQTSGSACPDNLPIIEHQTGFISGVQPAGTVGLGSGFIDSLPSHNDSANPDCELVYKVPDSTNRSWYKLSAVNCLSGVDSSSGTQSDDELALCPGSCSSCAGETMDSSFYSDADFYESLAIYSPGGRCQ